MDQATGLIFWRNVNIDRKEARVHGWQAVIVRTAPGADTWQAWLAPLAGGVRHQAPHTFATLDETYQWCEQAFAARLPIVRLAYQQEWPVPAEDLREQVATRLHQYDLLTARRLIPTTLSWWGAARATALAALEEYRGVFGLAAEACYYFYGVLHRSDDDLHLRRAEPADQRGGTPRQRYAYAHAPALITAGVLWCNAAVHHPTSTIHHRTAGTPGSLRPAGRRTGRTNPSSRGGRRAPCGAPPARGCMGAWMAAGVCWLWGRGPPTRITPPGVRSGVHRAAPLVVGSRDGTPWPPHRRVGPHRHARMPRR